MKHQAGTILSAILMAFVLPSQAWFLPYPKPAGRYPLVTPADSAVWAANLRTGWANWKSRYIQSNGVVIDPSQGSQAVSEGMGYGMLFAVMMNDQPTFDRIWRSAETNFWVSTLTSAGNDIGWYAWRTNNCTGSACMAASDGDEDIALALIFADMLQEYGYWANTSITVTHRQRTGSTGEPDFFPVVGGGHSVTLTYRQKAFDVLRSIGRLMITNANDIEAGHLKPWNWEFPPTLNDVNVLVQNPSYLAPAWYRVFHEYESRYSLISSTNWGRVIQRSYQVLRAQPSYNRGLARDWSLHDGRSVGDLLPNPHNTDMYYDGIRTPWRFGVDLLWYPNDSARQYNANIWAGGTVDPSNPGFYGGLDGTPFRRSENFQDNRAARAMWAAAAAAGRRAGVSGASAAATTLGNALRNQVSSNDNFYFDNSLALFGGLMVAGAWANVLADLDTVRPAGNDPGDTTLRLTAPLIAADTLQWDAINPISFTFSRTIGWTVTVRGLSSNATFTRTGTSGGGFTWRPSRIPANPSPFRSGERARLTLSVPGWNPQGGNPSIEVVLQDTARGASAQQARHGTHGRILFVRSGMAEFAADLPAGSALEVIVRDLGGRELARSRDVAVPGARGTSVRLPGNLPGGLVVLEIRDASAVSLVRGRAILP